MDVDLIIKTLGPTYLALGGTILVACLMVWGFSKAFGLLRAWYYSVSVGSSVKKAGLGDNWDYKAFDEKYAQLKKDGLVR